MTVAFRETKQSRGPRGSRYTDPVGESEPWMAALDFDYVLVGGGLQNALVALALLDRPRPPRIALVEQGPRLGGNHTWCFHDADVPEALRHAVEPLVVARWPGYQVAFPGQTRRMATPYAAVTSRRLDQVVRDRLDGEPGCEVLLGAAARSVEAHRVEVDRNGVLRAHAVIDARGPQVSGAVAGTPGTGWQKFVGVELELAAPHGLSEPILMDATVPQLDGYRFVYLLPLAPDRVLVEDTYFSDTPALDHDLVRARAFEYAAALGMIVTRVAREESGVLPMPWRSVRLPLPRRAGPLEAGYQGGWFHPATGYSFPVAARLAELIARLPAHQLFGPELAELASRIRRQSSFCRGLNRLLFRWCTPSQRWQVLARFYRLPDETIRRFYALDLGPRDAARIMLGRPPRGLSLRARLAARSGAGNVDATATTRRPTAAARRASTPAPEAQGESVRFHRGALSRAAGPGRRSRAR